MEEEFNESSGAGQSRVVGLVGSHTYTRKQRVRDHRVYHHSGVALVCKNDRILGGGAGARILLTVLAVKFLS